MSTILRIILKSNQHSATDISNGVLLSLKVKKAHLPCFGKTAEGAHLTESLDC